MRNSKHNYEYLFLISKYRNTKCATVVPTYESKIMVRTIAIQQYSNQCNVYHETRSLVTDVPRQRKLFRIHRRLVIKLFIRVFHYMMILCGPLSKQHTEGWKVLHVLESFVMQCRNFAHDSICIFYDVIFIIETNPFLLKTLGY